MNLSLLNSILAGKSEKEAEDIRQTFRNALSGQSGHELVQLLVEHRNPLQSRFAPGRTNEEAAYIDGQTDVISALMIIGTNMGISKPE
jgi:hypothetical protein